MSELSHQGAIRLIYQRRLNDTERLALQAHLRDCEACRRDAETAFLLSRQLVLKQIPTRPSPQLAAIFMERAARRYRRSQIMKPIYALGGAVALALIMFFGWYATRPNVQIIQAAQPTRPAVAAIPTVLAEALQNDAQPRQEEPAATVDAALQELIGAVKAGDAERVSALLAAGVAIDAADGAGHVLLPTAAREGNLAIVQLLLDAGADVNSTMDGAAPDETPYSQAPALMYAAAWGHLEVVELLLANGADADQAEQGFGTTPLHAAAWFNRDDVVRVLLENGAAVDARGSARGLTPLQMAVINNSIEAAEALLEAGADVHLVEEQSGRSLLSLAFSGTLGNANGTIKLLLDAGADANAAASNGATPLIYAVTSTAAGRIERVAWLLEAGADPDAQDMSGNTALHHAAKWGKRDVVELLIAHGAALDIQNIEGKTALDAAMNDEIRDMLRAAGATES